jgi:hypothetical protein
VPRIALGELLGDEVARGVGLDLGLEARGGLVVQRRVAPDVARFEQSGAHGHVGLGLAHHLVERTRRMPDLQLHVPKRIEHRFDDLLAPAGDLPRRQEADVDVRMRRHLAAAIAADRDQGQPLGGAGIMVGVQPLDGEVPEQSQQLIDQERPRRRHLVPARGMLGQPPRDFRLSGVERGLERDRRRPAKPGRIGRLHGRQPLGHGPPVDQGAAVGNRIKARGHGVEIGEPGPPRHRLRAQHQPTKARSTTKVPGLAFEPSSKPWRSSIAAKSRIISVLPHSITRSVSGFSARSPGHRRVEQPAFLDQPDPPGGPERLARHGRDIMELEQRLLRDQRIAGELRGQLVMISEVAHPAHAVDDHDLRRTRS